VHIDVIPSVRQATLQLHFAAGSVLDLALNPLVRSTVGGVSTNALIYYDGIPPQCVLTTPTVRRTNTLLTYTAQLSETVLWFNPSTISVTGASSVLLFGAREAVGEDDGSGVSVESP
jgi:hypothetical protein